MKKLLLTFLISFFLTHQAWSAVTNGTSAGFVLTAPTSDPGGSTDQNGDDYEWGCKFTSPSDAIGISAMGWYCQNATQAANYQIGLYAHDAANNRPGTQLYTSGDIAKGTGAGWKNKTGLTISISPSTVYWLCVQLDDTSTNTILEYTTNASFKFDYISKPTGSALTSPWGTSSGTLGWITSTYAVYITLPTCSTQAATDVATTTATGNGNITSLGNAASCDARGVVYDTSSHGAPGNVAPASSGYASSATDTGTYSTGAFTKGITGLSAGTKYYMRAYTHNLNGGYAYGDEINFTTTSAAYSGAVIIIDE